MCRRSSIDRDQQVGIFPFPAGKVLGSIEAQQGCERSGCRVVGKLGAPSECSGGVAQGAQRMADVELTVAEGALAVFPGLPPMHGSKTDPQARRGLGASARDFGAPE